MVNTPNDPSSATRRTRHNDCNHEAPAGFAAVHVGPFVIRMTQFPRHHY